MEEMEENTYMNLQSKALEVMDGGKVSGFFEYVASNGHNLSKDDLITIIKELDYSVYHKTTKTEYNEIIADSLETIFKDSVDDWEAEREDALIEKNDNMLGNN